MAFVISEEKYMSEVNTQNETEKKESTSPMQKAFLLDLGKKKRKLVKRLRKGRGKLLDRVQEELDELRADGSIDASAQTVIVVVAEKKRGPRWM